MPSKCSTFKSNSYNARLPRTPLIDHPCVFCSVSSQVEAAKKGGCEHGRKRVQTNLDRWISSASAFQGFEETGLYTPTGRPFSAAWNPRPEKKRDDCMIMQNRASLKIHFGGLKLSRSSKTALPNLFSIAIPFCDSRIISDFSIYYFSIFSFIKD